MMEAMPDYYAEDIENILQENDAEDAEADDLEEMNEPEDD